MGEIVDIMAREVIDSKGNSNVELDGFLKTGVRAAALVPYSIEEELAGSALYKGNKPFYNLK